MDLVSIIVPIYNAERYLEECIKSILSQSYRNIELILINDGSQDASLEICNDFKERDSRIKVINKNNSGVSDSRNIGLNNAVGYFVCFVDADDVIEENYVEVLHKEISKDNLGAVFCNFSYNYNGNFVKKKARIPSGIYYTSVINKIIIDDGTLSGILFGSVCCAIYKRDIIVKHKMEFDRQIKLNEDGLFNICYCLNVETIKVLSHLHLYIYRQTNESVTTKSPLNNSSLPATKAINDLCKNNTDINLHQQLEARKVTEAFWLVLKICSSKNPDKYKTVIQKLKKILNNKQITDAYNFININKINKFKYVYFILMKNKCYRTLFFLNRYVYPVLKKKISR